MLREIVKKMIPNWLIVRHLPSSYDNSVILTFDDGPCEVNTPKVLELLKKYDAKAFFFVVGHRIEKAPHILKMITDGGHLICNHSYSHNNSKFMGLLATYNDLKKCNELIEKYGEQKSRFYRPPGGKINIYNYLISIFLRQKILFWSLECQDWKCKNSIDAKSAADKIVDNIKSGSIILLHDDHAYIENILQTILCTLQFKGLRSVTYGGL